ncbi:MAG: MiaB/RimO family radical SAM methylthiotransferase [Elusimicrobia bacterium]|nr:MiaB/RimO family radical SAM methylthiotransferase [Elusimicrobiota bacterium]
MVKIFIKSFGCRVNQYEGEQIRESFFRQGAEFTIDFNKADVCVINTCSVTANADRDARLLFRKINRANPSARKIVTGCYASRAPDELKILFPKAEIVPNEGKNYIPLPKGEGRVRVKVISSFYGHTRAWIKIQDGCDRKCAFCIVPKIRPAMSCRNPDVILAEIRGLLDRGYREFVLCGIRLGRYSNRESAQFGRIELLVLIQKIAQLDGDFRIRLSSIEAVDLTDRFIEGYASTRKTVPYFHIPLQSGCDSVLAAMKRGYKAEFFRKRLDSIRRILGSDAAIFTDFMAGFPTETQENFQESLAFARRMGFAGMHIFPFSPRPGTIAVNLKPVYAASDLKARIAEARELDRSLRQAYALRFVGKELKVLWETRRKGSLMGRAENFLEVIGTKMVRINIQLTEGVGSFPLTRHPRESVGPDADRGLDSRFRGNDNNEWGWQTVKIRDAREGRLFV